MSEEFALKKIYEEIEVSKKELEQRIIKFHIDCENIIARIKDRVRELERIRTEERGL